MGILIDTEIEEDKTVYMDAAKDIESIVHNSEDFSYVKVPQKKTPAIELKSQKNRMSSSKLRTTKELSELTGINSRRINSWFTENRMMYKKDDDWYITKKGVQSGGVLKEGQYGKFIIWPEDIALQIQE